jgi:2-phosphoglycerate kinase
MEWRILLIGGGSGVGKTGLARAVASQAACSVLLADDLRLGIQQVTTPLQHPTFHTFPSDEAAASLPADEFRDGLIAVARAMSPALQAVMAHHYFVDGAGPLVIEGDALLPQLAAQEDLAELGISQNSVETTRVRSVFLVEPSEEALLRNMRDRGRGFETLGPLEQRTYAHASWLYGQWLADQARRYGRPIVEPRPWRTLLERVNRAIGSERNSSGYPQSS